MNFLNRIFNKDDVFEHQKKAEKNKVIESKSKAQLVAEIFNTLKKGCTSSSELSERLEVMKELDQNFNWTHAQKALEIKGMSIENARKVIELAKETDDETILIQPEGLQAEIEVTCSKFIPSRAFARPSGTEDVVRIYAEGSTQEKADELAQEIFDIISSKYKD